MTSGPPAVRPPVPDPDFVLDAAARERLIDRFGSGAAQWCDTLPELVSRCCLHWDLELDEARSGATSRVFLGRQRGGRSRATTAGELAERIQRLCALIPDLDRDRLQQWCQATAVIIAVQHLYRRPPDDTTELVLQLSRA